MSLSPFALTLLGLASLGMSVVLGPNATAQESQQAPGETPAAVFQSETTLPKTFTEVFGFREYFIAPGEPAEPGFMVGVEYFRSSGPKRRYFWANCALDTPVGLPVVRNEDGSRMLFPWVSCSFAPINRQVGEGAPGDMTNSNKPFTTFYDRNPGAGLRHDVKVYVLGYRRGKYFELHQRVRVFASLAVNMVGARMVQFLEEEDGKTTSGAFQPLAWNPEIGFAWDITKKVTLTVTALGIQGHWSVAPAQAGRFGPMGADLQTYVKARLDIGRFSIASEYDFYRFAGTGLPSYNAFIVGAKLFSWDWTR